MSLARRVTNLFSRRKIHQDIQDELQAHLGMRTEDNIVAGMPAEEARRDAVLRFGNPAALHEQVVAADASLTLESIAADVRYGLRQLRAAPGFAVTSILILGVAIGGCTAIFSAVKPILLDSLPYPNARQIMMIWEMGGNSLPSDVTFGTFQGLTQQARSFDSLAVMKPWQPTIKPMTSGTDRPERFEGQRVSAGYFRTLGAAPILGADFRREDDRLHGPDLVILSDALWRRRFAADRSIVGKQVRLDDDLYTVAGVMPASFENVLAPAAELWAPLQYDSSLPFDGREWGHHLRMIGRLRPGVTAKRAENELAVILRTLVQINAKGYASSGGPPKGMIVHALQSDLTQSVKPALLAVFGAMFLLLLMACVNVTNLLLERGGQRSVEFAMRAALGAAQSRLVRQLLTESLLLATFGSIFGMMVAIAGVRTLVWLSPDGLPRVDAIRVDTTVFLFALGITTCIGILVGLVPALQVAGRDLQNVTRQSSRSTIGGRHWTRRGLVTVEVSLATMLLVGTGLLLRSMQHLFAVDPGFSTSHLLTMEVQNSSQRQNDAARLRFLTQAALAARAVPGVVAAAFTDQLPLNGDFIVYGIEFAREHNPLGDTAVRYAVTPGYLETMHIPLRAGRVLSDHDTMGSRLAVVINESFAKRKFGAQDPVGQRVRVGVDVGHTDRPWGTIVGVVGNVKQASLALGDADSFYVSTAQWALPDPSQTLVVRTRDDAAGLVPAIREAIWSVDGDEAIVRVAKMRDMVNASEAQRHFVLILFAAFAVVGLLLAATGIYGVLAGSVSERTREIGVRSALGASRGNILSLVMGQGMTVTLGGILVGLAAAVLASRALAMLLFGVGSFDVVTYASVAALLLLVAAIACFVPAYRALSVNPVEALRAE
jgi:putative ABC transport system permease protein